MSSLLKLKLVFCCAILLFLWSCTKKTEVRSSESDTLFTKIEPSQSNITFKNKYKEDLYFNFINYPYIYNGGGVAIGDVNNDGLEDVYFTSNQGSNNLYLNLGNFEFQNITDKANVGDLEGWATGVTMVDINNDGFLDIYVCKSGSLNSHQLRRNKLFVNQKNNTFKESAAEYGLDHFGFSVQSYFFDADKDGDLDMYLVNHRHDFRNNVVLDENLFLNKEAYSSDQFFENDKGRFVNKTKESGVLNKAWGLSASIGDFNNDGFSDVYVANDFLEPDYLYLNQGDGTFKEDLKNNFKHISHNSMGSDFADINNDLKPDLVVLDMMAEDHIRGKENMATMSTDNFWAMVNFGYHYQYMSNVLQLNNGDGSFSDIGQLAGIAKTDWSWAPLLADFDNDGYNDLFVTNGIEKDLSNQDFRNRMKQNIINRKKVKLEEAIDMMPSSKLSNYVFRNTKEFRFKNSTKQWGLQQEVNSNGAAYADLDNDGDLDLVVNNQSELAHVFRNNSNSNYVSFSFKGSKKNRNGIGAEVQVFNKGTKQVKTNYLSRGFQSSVSCRLNFGLGTVTEIDSVKVIWPDGLQEKIIDISINEQHVLSHDKATFKQVITPQYENFFEKVESDLLQVNFKQKENVFNDFDLQLLLPQKQSEISRALTVGDVNKDGLEDFFVGNSKGHKAGMFLQNKNGTFSEINSSLFEKEKVYEDTSAEFLDVDNDGDLDLVVTSGGYEVKEKSTLLNDRLYINNGNGKFYKNLKFPKLYSNSSQIVKGDFDNDGDLDLFLTTRVKHGKYPLSEGCYLLENKNGAYTDVTAKLIDASVDLKMVNDAVFTDIDTDGDLDLVVVGEWMSPIVLENKNNVFQLKNIPNLKNTNGWFQSITKLDFNHDGREDYLIGNYGLNNKFHPSSEKPLHLYAGYMDANKTFDVVLSKESKTGKLLPVRGRECSTQQVPSLGKKVQSFKEFAGLDLNGIYGEDCINKADHLLAHTMETVLLQNINGTELEFAKLPIEVQLGPLLGAVVLDVNSDGFMDVVGVGNIYEAEVETIRYDAVESFVLLGNKEGELKYTSSIKGLQGKEVKAIEQIEIKGEIYLVILCKNRPLEFYKIKKANTL